MAMGFHDSTFFGWLTTGLYVAAATLCAIAARWPGRTLSVHQPSRKRIALFWMSAGIVLFVLAINKQLDMQTVLTDTLRDMAERGGWYGKRRMWQFIFVVMTTGVLAGAVWGVHRMLGGHWRNHRLALAGIVLVGAYLLLRVVDIERMGEMTNLPLSATRVRTVVEWAGLLCLAAAGWRHAVLSDPDW